jgi:hypothetical protein
VNGTTSNCIGGGSETQTSAGTSYYQVGCAAVDGMNVELVKTDVPQEAVGLVKVTASEKMVSF